MDLCVRVMVDTVTEHLQQGTSLEDVVFVALDPREFNPLQAKIEGGVS